VKALTQGRIDTDHLAVGVTYLQFPIQVCFFSYIAGTGFPNFTFTFSCKRTSSCV